MPSFVDKLSRFILLFLFSPMYSLSLCLSALSSCSCSHSYLLCNDRLFCFCFFFLCFVGLPLFCISFLGFLFLTANWTIAVPVRWRATKSLGQAMNSTLWGMKFLEMNFALKIKRGSNTPIHTICPYIPIYIHKHT